MDQSVVHAGSIQLQDVRWAPLVDDRAAGACVLA